MVRGRIPTLVAEAYERWPIEASPDLPSRLKGVYVLYDPHGEPIKVGKAGDVRGRILGDYYRHKKWRGVDTFSVYTFDRGETYHQIEVLVLRMVGKRLRGNKNVGHFRKKTRRVKSPPKKQLKPNYFLTRAQVKSDGLVRAGKKYAGRRVRIEVGPQNGT